jgi:NAD(P)-dependent dehydrogenase (short-subunit alcohol dehydrogenase family)
MGSFDGKTVIVTGGGSGIGRATAIKLADKGAGVLVADFVEDGGLGTVSEIEAMGGRAAFVKVDVSDEASVQAMVVSAVDRFGKVDGLVNSAGIAAAGQFPTFADTTLEAFNRVLAVNVVGTFLAMKHAIPEMLKAGGGAVVNLSSTMGDRGAAGDPSYATSKHAVRGLTKGAALSYAEQGVRVNCIGPGVVMTAMTAPILEAEQTMNWLLSITPMRRFAEPEEIANLIAFLLSDKASYITGAYYPVDGGWLAA